MAKITAFQKQSAAYHMAVIKWQKQQNKLAKEDASIMGTRIRRVAAWAVMWNVAYGAINRVKQAIGAVASRALKMEMSVARVSMVIGESNAAIREHIDLLSKRYGRSVDDVGKALESFARQGIGFGKAIQMTDIAMQGALATGESTARMVERLTGLYHGWGLSVMETRSALDEIIATSKRAAITASQLADAHIRLAATARDMGIGFSDVNKLVISMVEAMRLTGKEASTTLATILQRLQRAKTMEVFERAGVQTELGGGAFRQPMDVLKDIAAKWGEFSDAMRRDIIQALAGIRRGRQARLLMAKLPEIIDRLGESMGSAGETARDAATAMDTYTESINRMKQEGAGLIEHWWTGVQALRGGGKGPSPLAIDIERGMRRQEALYPTPGDVGHAGRSRMLGEMQETLRKALIAGIDPTKIEEAFLEALALGPGRFARGRDVEFSLDVFVDAMLGASVSAERFAGTLNKATGTLPGALRRYKPARPEDVPGYGERQSEKELTSRIFQEIFGLGPGGQPSMLPGGPGAGAVFERLRGLGLSEEPTTIKALTGLLSEAQSLGAGEAIARTPEERLEIRKQIIKNETMIASIMEEQLRTTTKMGETEKEKNARLAKASDMQKIVNDENNRLEKVGIELIKERIELRDRELGQMRSAVESGLFAMMMGREGRVGETLGKGIGDVVGQRVMSSIGEQLDPLIKGFIAPRGKGGARKGWGDMSGMEKFGSILGYGVMGYQAAGAGGAGGALAGAGIGGAIGASFGAPGVGADIGAGIGTLIASLLSTEVDIEKQHFEVAKRYYDASLEEMQIMNRSLAMVAGYSEYGLPSSYYYRQRPGGGVQQQALVFGTREGVTNVVAASLIHSVRGTVVI
jgi:TP901 family phage tail tape measure protein